MYMQKDRVQGEGDHVARGGVYCVADRARHGPGDAEEDDAREHEGAAAPEKARSLWQAVGEKPDRGGDGQTRDNERHDADERRETGYLRAYPAGELAHHAPTPAKRVSASVASALREREIASSDPSLIVTDPERRRTTWAMFTMWLAAIRQKLWVPSSSSAALSDPRCRIGSVSPSMCQYRSCLRIST